MKKKNIFIFNLLLIILLIGCTTDTTTINQSKINLEGEILEVHFIDIGQGDSTYIKYPNGKNLLIDGGSKSKAEILINYLNNQGIEEIDTIIATHPHEDHIGSLPEVIRNFKVNNMYLPKKTSNTNIFEELLLEVKKNKISLKEGKKDLNLLKENNFSVDLLWPDGDYKNTNNNSIVTKITYGNIKTLIMADAEKEVEKALGNDKNNIKADILRVGHHGSNTSSTLDFLKKVNPKYSIISVGEGNKYGHPDMEAMENLKEIKTEVLRTDRDGNIVFYIDGKNIEVDKIGFIEEKTESKRNIIGNTNTKVFHLLGCKSIPNKENTIYFKDIKEAEIEGYRPHKNCIK